MVHFAHTFKASDGGGVGGGVRRKSGTQQIIESWVVICFHYPAHKLINSGQFAMHFIVKYRSMKALFHYVCYEATILYCYLLKFDSVNFMSISLCRQRYNYHTRHTRHRVTPCNQRRNTATSDSICAISYPPPCPPAYEVEPTVHTPPRRPRRKANSSRSRLVLPQYTDFRPEVYAELPPYEEKPPIDGNE